MRGWDSGSKLKWLSAEGRLPKHEAAETCINCRAEICRYEALLKPEIHQWILCAPKLELAVGEVAPKGRLGGRKMRQRLRQRIRRLDQALSALKRTLPPRDVHRARIMAKKLCYSSQLLESAFPGVTRRLIDRAGHLQSVLGDLHDIDILSGVARQFVPPQRRGSGAHATCGKSFGCDSRLELTQTLRRLRAKLSSLVCRSISSMLRRRRPSVDRLA